MPLAHAGFRRHPDSWRLGRELEAAGRGEGGGRYLDGKKKVKLDQPARHPAGSGGEKPEGKCRSGRLLQQVEEVRPRAVEGTRSSCCRPKYKEMSGVWCGERAPAISKQPPLQADARRHREGKKLQGPRRRVCPQRPTPAQVRRPTGKIPAQSLGLLHCGALGPWPANLKPKNCLKRSSSEKMRFKETKGTADLAQCSAACLSSTGSEFDPWYQNKDRKLIHATAVSPKVLSPASPISSSTATSREAAQLLPGYQGTRLITHPGSPSQTGRTEGHLGSRVAP
ncbi:uncharacterized protein LOC117287290 isoform X2 [Fukomys damarensis]|uniref:uncharacterized protein LOC117287290 isoform X2 n=1 Tax=Fukomys damarensis TaxID=885580 RepID=UPI0014556B32|nr:uncharacterized protein LOC117287290 isoform X2 [Fukomys damarensis]